MWQEYTSVPTEVRAIYWDGTDDVLQALKAASCRYELEQFGPAREDRNLRILAGVGGVQGWVDVPVGHYVINMSSNGVLDFYPCDKTVFERKYQPKSA